MMLLNRNREFQNHKSQSYYPQELDIDRSLDERHTLDLTDAQLSRSPFSTARSRAAYSTSGTQSQSLFANLDTAPSSTVPRRQDPITLIKLPPTTPPTELDDFSISITQPPDLMQSDSWMLGSHFTPKSGGRLSHNRESSLSSLGSAGPASPFTQNSSNPHVALNDSTSDGFHDMQQDNNSYYQLAKMVPSQETIFTGYHPYHGLDTRGSEMDYTSSGIMHKPKVDRGLLPAPDLSLGANTSHTASVASSIGGDSPATPSLGEPDDNKRRKAGFNVPKLDRTMTDIYSDELYSPNFTITSASSSHGPVPVSPGNDVFSQRLHAANSQHLSAVHSPVVGVSRERSPFRQGSPLAPVPGQHFGNTMPPGRLDYHAGNRKLRGNARLEEDRVLDMREPADLGTPKTISPKDAILEFHDMDEEGNFPLFPSQQSSEFHVQQLSATPISQATQGPFSQPTSFSASSFPLLPPQIQPIVQIPQRYPFIARQNSDQSAAAMLNVETTKLRRTTPAGNVSGTHKPAGASADGGTYTCTYHGCTLRFETPALLQKHKREGHRQAQTLTCVRKGDSGMTSGLQNSQAGPHRCDRINPSTGKSCNTIFSRPYDLTRHEDTIHNARKQKVRCGLCTEEKTFSRADALTRHYRVCHPDIEFSGKHRKRGGQGR